MKINLSIIFEEGNIKNFTISLFVFSIQLFSQIYLNIHYTDDSYNNTPLNSIQKITFYAGGDQLIVLLTDESSTTDDCSTIGELTYSNEGFDDPLFRLRWKLPYSNIYRSNIVIESELIMDHYILRGS